MRKGFKHMVFKFKKSPGNWKLKQNV